MQNLIRMKWTLRFPLPSAFSDYIIIDAFPSSTLSLSLSLSLPLSLCLCQAFKPSSTDLPTASVCVYSPNLSDAL